MYVYLIFMSLLKTLILKFMEKVGSLQKDKYKVFNENHGLKNDYIFLI